jgi:hypothetical protein
MANAVIVPINIASPPNLGIGLSCILRPSFGTSTAPIFGAKNIETGVKISASAKDVKNIKK